ncbi:MAG TPA: hypothetical protein VHZ26_00760 [Caulobacteraceae bacterium]|jgi:hypothetical protein|nr:hypothetical protein [Caulobacteraceae bacterium]
MSAKTPEQERNERLVRQFYHLAEGATKNTEEFVSLFGPGGYFYNVSEDKKY